MAWLLSLRNRSSLSMVQSVKQMFPYQAVVTGRFHMACIAMLLNQPFVAIASNTHKLEGMLDDAGIDASAYLIPQDDASLSMINHRVLQMVSQTHADMQEQSQAYVAHARSRIELMLQQIARPRMTRIQPLIHAV
jgi:polysaccharide pyruvyl transferase WcaK-like protein